VGRRTVTGDILVPGNKGLISGIIMWRVSFELNEKYSAVLSGKQWEFPRLFDLLAVFALVCKSWERARWLL
jgi:hypothetical protein